jgi:hypothetical protein
LTTRRIIFLDIDGVLNSERWRKSPDYEMPKVMLPGARRWRPGNGAKPTQVEPRGVNIEPEAVRLLNFLVREDIEWVLSSTWRADGTGHKLVSQILQQLSWTGTLVDSTPVLQSATSSVHVDHSRKAQPTRGDEIAAWLDAHGIKLGDDVRIAIIDDDADLGELLAYRVDIDDGQGLVASSVMRAAILLDVPLVMVDDVFKPDKPRRTCFRKGAAHLTVSSDRHLDALHEFARAAFRFPREWFQEHRIAPHYDLTKGHQKRALDAGALLVPALEQARVRHWARDRGLR